MNSSIREKCGVFAIVSGDSKTSVSEDIANGLIALQHRGQESAGISTLDGEHMYTTTGMGLVTGVFSESDLAELKGSMGIGHVRYSTTGDSDSNNAQPIVIIGKETSIAIGFNGNILNYKELKEEMVARGFEFKTTTDTELIGLMILENLRKGIESAVKNLMEKLDGSYSLVLLTKRGEVYGIRDPLGFKPFVLGKRKGDFILASEIPAVEAVGGKFVREVEPGELICLHEEGKGKVLKTERRAHCFFEWVYFARPDTLFAGRNPYSVREKLGRKLADLYPLNLDVAIGVPDSGRTAALGYSKQSGITFEEGLIKNRYIWRTFIMPGQQKRSSTVKLKLNPIKSVIKGKRVAIVDDSLVRGTTMKKIVRILREAGAKEVHVLISAPPIIAPCYMGIDFPTYGELAACGKTVDEIRKEIGADGLYYMTIEGLLESINLPRGNLCLACITDEYPTKKRPAVKEGQRKRVYA